MLVCDCGGGIRRHLRDPRGEAGSSPPGRGLIEPAAAAARDRQRARADRRRGRRRPRPRARARQRGLRARGALGQCGRARRAGSPERAAGRCGLEAHPPRGERLDERRGLRLAGRDRGPRPDLSEDAQEGARAFAERRDPARRGRQAERGLWSAAGREPGARLLEPADERVDYSAVELASRVAASSAIASEGGLAAGKDARWSSRRRTRRRRGSALERDSSPLMPRR